MKDPLVSILICTYNAAETIKETTYSCLQQTYSNIQILIHDDQSGDNTVALISEIKDKRIQLVHSGKKLGPYGGLNYLMGYAKGAYIAIQDHDDLWHPEKIKKQINFLEHNKEYIGCGTKTLMWYEGDQQGFEYYLGQENWYTIHPSLVFRNQGQRYPTDSVYMNDALFQKKILCKGKKSIFNLNETLTMHRIKDAAANFSYKWFQYSWSTFRTIFMLHPVWYGICVIGWETMRKIVYPCLRLIGKGKLIDRIERLPFKMMGNRMNGYSVEKLRDMGIHKN